MIDKLFVDTVVNRHHEKFFINILKGLNSNFEPIDLIEGITKLIPRLTSYLENSGIFFEKSIEI